VYGHFLFFRLHIFAMRSVHSSQSFIGVTIMVSPFWSCWMNWLSLSFRFFGGFLYVFSIMPISTFPSFMKRQYCFLSVVILLAPLVGIRVCRRI
jgi:hypothetical protein